MSFDLQITILFFIVNNLFKGPCQGQINCPKSV